jgi:ubiquinone/menaquinone biosynthesis C-methylase UbiE
MTSLPQDFTANYDGEVAEFWVEAFRSVPAKGHMVDLCTGNGAIALLAVDYARKSGHELDITAVDAATISPASLAEMYPDQSGPLEEINFVSNCRVEDLELESAGFDLVTSQFGIEYCDWQQAAEQVERLLKPGGSLVMVTHTATSDILRFMEQEHREYALLDQLELMPSMQRYLQGDLSFSQLRAKLTGVQENLGNIFQRTGSPLFRSVLGAVGGILNLNETELDARKDELEEYHGQLRHGHDRLADMLRVNKAIAADPDWHTVFGSAGLEQVKSGEIRYRGQHHAGGYLVFRKP